MLSNILIMSITILTRALNDLKIRVFSELCILLTSDCFLIFNMVSVEENFVLGYVSVGVVGLFLLISMLIVVINVIISFQKRIRIWRIMRR